MTFMANEPWAEMRRTDTPLALHGNSKLIPTKLNFKNPERNLQIPLN